MIKKIQFRFVVLLCLIFIIILIGYGAVLVHDGQRFPFLKKNAIILAEIPRNLKNIYLHIVEPDFPFIVKDARHADKPRFTRFIQTKRDELLLLSRFDGDNNKYVVEIVNLNDFSVLHTYKINSNKIFSQINLNREEFKNILIKKIPSSFLHPLITNSGDLLSVSSRVLVKTDFCNNLLWINDVDQFHHSINIDHEGNYWVPTKIFPYAVNKELVGTEFENYSDDAITKVSPNGKILYQKSISEILIEKNYKHLLFSQSNYFPDPIHLNDIQPVLQESQYWQKGDIFLSLRNLSMIVLFRPSTNKIIKIITGDFYNQHDVDIISNSEISIFNNNVFHTKKGRNIIKNNAVIIYNFKKNKFFQYFPDSMKKHKVKTVTGGLSEILKDGSMIIEESNHARILFINNKGNLEWEYINKASNDNIYNINWIRIIDDKNLIKNIKQKIKDTKCLN